MIACGYTEDEKASLIRDTITRDDIKKLFFIGDVVEGDYGIPTDHVSFQDSVMYVHYYRFLGNVDNTSLCVWNNAMRTQNRYSLNYNCIRKYMQQTSHRLVFERFPIVSDRNDFMILYDMDQPNPFLKEKYEYVTAFHGVVLKDQYPHITMHESTWTPEQISKYAEVKAEAIADVKKNADIIPNRCLKFAETMDERIMGRKFDTKKHIKPIMDVCVGPTGADRFFYNRLLQISEEIRDVSEKVR